MPAENFCWCVEENATFFLLAYSRLKNLINFTYSVLEVIISSPLYKYMTVITGDIKYWTTSVTRESAHYQVLAESEELPVKNKVPVGIPGVN